MLMQSPFIMIFMINCDNVLFFTSYIIYNEWTDTYASQRTYIQLTLLIPIMNAVFHSKQNHIVSQNQMGWKTYEMYDYLDSSIQRKLKWVWLLNISSHFCGHECNPYNEIFLVQVRLRTEVLCKFDPTGARTHDHQIITVHFISLRHLL